MELWWLVPVVFGAVMLVVGVLWLAVLIPAARKRIEADRAKRGPDPEV